LLALIIAFATRLVPLVAQTTDSGDPVSLFTSLGVGGVVAVVLYLWQRDTAKQRDRAVSVVEQLAPLIAEVRTAVQLSNEAHRASASAAQSMSESLARVPSDEVLTRLRVALERVERMQEDSRYR
jgi:hypothetical protein